MIELARQPGTTRRGLFQRFGRLAPDDECQTILQALAAENEPEVQRKLLGIFWSAGLRAWDDTVWKLAHSEDEGVRLAAIRAMASLEDSRIGDLARLGIADPGFLPRAATRSSCLPVTTSRATSCFSSVRWNGRGRTPTACTALA